LNVFKDIKIIELASVLAGPAVGMFFAELGAEVIKIENKANHGDVTRSWKLPGEDSSKKTSAYFNAVNFGKQHQFKNLKEKTELEEVKDLIKNADVLISNFKKRSAEKLGLDFHGIRKINPKIIHCNLIGFESSAKTAYDIVLQAETGWIEMTGSPKNKAKIPVAMIDLMAAHQMKEAVLIGLLHRMKFEEGKSFEVSLEKAALSSLANLGSNFLNEKFIAKRKATLHSNIAPYGEIIKSKDEIEFVLAIGSDIQFHRFCKLFDLTELSSDPAFKTNQNRVINRLNLLDLIQRKTCNYKASFIEEQCLKNDIPIGKIKSIDKVLNSEIARSMILKNGEDEYCLSTVAFREIDF